MRYSFWKLLRNFWLRWREITLEVKIKRQQALLNQAAWQNSLAERTQDADLAAGYDLGHFNTMQ